MLKPYTGMSASISYCMCVYACVCSGTSDPDGQPSRSLMETLTRMENEGSSSDEENAEQNNIMFEKTASSAGCKRVMGMCSIIGFVLRSVM